MAPGYSLAVITAFMFETWQQNGSQLSLGQVSNLIWTETMVDGFSLESYRRLILFCISVMNPGFFYNNHLSWAGFTHFPLPQLASISTPMLTAGLDHMLLARPAGEANGWQANMELKLEHSHWIYFWMNSCSMLQVVHLRSAGENRFSYQVHTCNCCTFCDSEPN